MKVALLILSLSFLSASSAFAEQIVGKQLDQYKEAAKLAMQRDDAGLNCSDDATGTDLARVEFLGTAGERHNLDISNYMVGAVLNSEGVTVSRGQQTILTFTNTDKVNNVVVTMKITSNNDHSIDKIEEREVRSYGPQTLEENRGTLSKPNIIMQKKDSDMRSFTCRSGRI